MYLTIVSKRKLWNNLFWLNLTLRACKFLITNFLQHFNGYNQIIIWWNRLVNHIIKITYVVMSRRTSKLNLISLLSLTFSYKLTTRLTNLIELSIRSKMTFGHHIWFYMTLISPHYGCSTLVFFNLRQSLIFMSNHNLYITLKKMSFSFKGGKREMTM